MKTRIQKWGNSLGLRIPKPFAEEIGLRDDGVVELSLHNGRLLLKPEPPPPPSLAKLLGGIRRSNVHTAVETGPAQGREAW